MRLMPLVRVAWSLSVLGLVFTLSSGLAFAHAPFPRPPLVNLIRLDGRLGAPQPGDKGTTDLRLEALGTTYRVQLSRLEVLTGPSRLSADILSAVQPYRPSFFLRGAEAMLQRLHDAKPNDRVTVTAYYRGGRDLLVTEVDVTPAPMPVPSPTSPIR